MSCKRVSIGVLLALIGALACSTAAGADAGHRVFVRTSGNHSELVKTIPITRSAGASPHVVMSLGKRLPDLADGDRLEVTAEVEVTDDCGNPGRRCVGTPYGYNPDVRARLVLARSASSLGGNGAISLSKPQRHVCLQQLPNREHHCVLVFGHGGLDIPRADNLPCQPQHCYVNVVLDAHNPNAGPNDKLLLGVDRPDGSIAQDRGRINATVLRPGSQAKPDPQSTDDRRTSTLIPDHRPRVIYSLRLPTVHRGDQLTVSAHAVVDVANLPYNTFTGAQLILADGPERTRSGKFARSIVHGGAGISEGTGFNCTHARTPCAIRKVGTLRVSDDALNHNGHPRPVFINLLATTAPKRTTMRSGDRVQVLDRGSVAARIYPR